MSNSDKIIRITEEFRDRVDAYRFTDPVECVYNPLGYAFDVYRKYIQKYAQSAKRVVFVGMNPGPFGMAQTGVPFGEISMVSDWLGLQGRIDCPKNEHPKRPVLGFDCPRSEVSGRRLWGLFQDEFKDAASFFDNHFVLNYCPLLFLNSKGANLTPDKLPKIQTVKLYADCDAYLKSLIEIMTPQHIVGVGNFAHKIIQRLFLNENHISIHLILHPSPASPRANKGWSTIAKRQLCDAGVW